MNRKFTLIAAGVILVVVLVVIKPWQHSTPSSTSSPNSLQSDEQTQTAQPATATPTSSNGLVLPLDRAGERITKKLFGTYVTPQNSPVSPERFKGYHSGLDFETFPEEKDADVVVKTICAGPLLTKRTVSGYGGVAIQKCTIEGQTVTVLYGHLRLASVSAPVNKDLPAGEALGVLGTGYSAETDGERKHLHLSIHKGAAIVLAGYVQNQSALSAWLDPKSILGL